MKAIASVNSVGSLGIHLTAAAAFLVIMGGSMMAGEVSIRVTNAAESNSVRPIIDADGTLQVPGSVGVLLGA